MRANLVTRNVLKIKRYAQRLTQRACMGEGGSYLWAPGDNDDYDYLMII